MSKYSISLGTLLLVLGLMVGCTTENPGRSDSTDPAVTQEVLDHHWETFVNNDLEGVMEDYTDESILITPDTTYRGLDAIRENFKKAFESFPIESSTLTLNKSVVVKDVGYILWQASTENFELRFATDTFIIRDGKIIRQTYGGVTDQQLQ